MSEKYLLFSLDDEKSKRLGEVISNPTCKKIVNFLAEREASASEIAKELGMPLNSVGYNVEKLVEAGIIEKVGGFLWSTKGKKIEKYKVANKLIVISPKRTNFYSKLKGIVPAVLAGGLFAGLVGWVYRANYASGALVERTEEKVMAAAPSVASESAVAIGTNPWIWAALGGLVVLVVFLIWNWKKM